MKNKKKIERWLYSIPILIILALLFYVIVHARIKFLSLITFDAGPILVSLSSLIFLVIGVIYSIKNKPFLTIPRVIGFLVLIILFFNIMIYGKFPSRFDDKPSAVAFRVPTDTELAVGWGGKSVKENYHAAYPDQCWAYDLVMAKDGKTHTGSGDKVTDYYCYGVPILAPANGKIIEAFDEDPDMPPGVIGGGTTAFGNYVIIEVAENEFLFICHMKPDSILVEVGDTVQKGQEIGAIGNSGNTDEPHIHMHLQSSSDYGVGIPMYFYDLEVDGVYTEKAIPTGGFDKDENLLGQTIKNAE